MILRQVLSLRFRKTLREFFHMLPCDCFKGPSLGFEPEVLWPHEIHSIEIRVGKSLFSRPLVPADVAIP